GRNIISGGSTGSASHGHRPNIASQNRVNTRVAGTPPAPRTYAAARAMCPASGGSPASRSAVYASTVVDGSGGPPWKVDQVPSGACRDLIQRAVSRVSSSVRMPRNSRRSRSSASIVTLVCSSPFHQPSGDWRPSRWSRAASRASDAVRGRGRPSPAAASVAVSAPVAVPAVVSAVVSVAVSVVVPGSMVVIGALPPGGASSVVPAGDEVGDVQEVRADGLGNPGRDQVLGGALDAPLGLHLRPGAPSRRLHQRGGLRQVLLGRLGKRVQLGEPCGLGGVGVERG